MKVIARHERDDRDIELNTKQELQLESELGLSISILFAAGIVSFKVKDGWSYNLTNNGETP